MSRYIFTITITLLVSSWMWVGCAESQQADDEIIHDAEFYTLKSQHDEAWEKQDVELDKKLKELREKHGAPPNIIHIMWDDMVYGGIGHPMLNQVSGYKTPNINEIASKGMTLTRMYTEPSCTPTRAATLTGRHPVRNGMYQVIFPIHGYGLADEEVTIAEILSKSGYATGIFEKPHLGDVQSAYPTNQGFDEAYIALYNQFAGQMFTETAENLSLTFGWSDDNRYYALDNQFVPKEYIWGIDAVKGGPVKQATPMLTYEDYLEFNREAFKRTKNFIRKNAEANKPFYLAWWPNVYEISPDRPWDAPHGTATGDSLALMDKKIAEIVDMTEELGIAENTIIVLMADNGPMKEIWPHTGQNGIFRGGKGSFLEGGVRVPAFVYWPETIEPGQVAGDIIHVTDLFTTFINLAGATEYIPRDRVIDGIDQTALLLEGDGNSRRDYVYIYQGPALGAIVKQQYKRHFAGERPGLVGKGFFDLLKDPREEHPLMAQFLWAWGNFDAMRDRHMELIKKYPNSGMNYDTPYVGIERIKEN